MFYLGFLLMELEGPREFRGGAERETPMLTVPLFHATGLLSGFLLPVQTGQKVVMMYKWDVDRALDYIEQERITTIAAAPAMVLDLLESERFQTIDKRSLFALGIGGAATPPRVGALLREQRDACARPTRAGRRPTRLAISRRFRV